MLVHSPLNGHPPFKENRKLPDLHTSKMHFKKKTASCHLCCGSASSPPSPSCWSERSVISFHNCKVILQAFSCGVFPRFFWERCPKKRYKNPRILWSFLSCWISTNLACQTKQQLLRPVLQLLPEISLGKCIHDVVVAGGALKALAMRSRNNLTRVWRVNSGTFSIYLSSL